MPKYIVKTRIKTLVAKKEVFLEEGSTIDLADAEAKELLAVGAISGPLPEAPSSPTK